MVLERYLRSVVCAAAVVACGCGTSDQSREAAAVREFHQRLNQGRADLIYSASSDMLRAQFSEAQFQKTLVRSWSLGRVEWSERAHYKRATANGGGDLVMAYYNSRYSNGACLESFTWRDEADGLKLAMYSCAPNMKVTCASGTACETSPVPVPGLAGLP